MEVCILPNDYISTVFLHCLATFKEFDIISDARDLANEFEADILNSDVDDLFYLRRGMLTVLHVSQSSGQLSHAVADSTEDCGVITFVYSVTILSFEYKTEEKTVTCRIC